MSAMVRGTNMAWARRTAGGTARVGHTRPRLAAGPARGGLHTRHRLLKNAQVPVKYHVQNGLMSYSYATVQCIRLIQLNPLPTTVSG